MLSHPGSQVNLGSNPFISAPLEVPDIPSRGSTGWRDSESLIRGRFVSPSGVVPPPTEEDVMPPINVSVLCSVDSLGLDRFSGSPFPPLGDSNPLSSQTDQLRDRGDLGLTQHVISADVHNVPRSVSAFDPSSLLLPFSDSGFSSLPPPTPSSLPSFSSLSSTAPSSTAPLFSLLSVVPSVLPPPSVASASICAPSSSFSMFSSSLPSSSFSTAPPLVSSSFSSSSFPLSSAFPPCSSSSPWVLSVPPASSFFGVASGVSSVSSSAPMGDFASFQA